MQPKNLFNHYNIVGKEGEKKMQYVGLADAHGLESFIPWTNTYVISLLNKDKAANDMVSMLFWRARANRHRHAVVYRATLSQEDANIVNDLVDKGKFKEALIKLKKLASVVEITNTLGMKKSWNLIPNDDLDPYDSM